MESFVYDAVTADGVPLALCVLCAGGGEIIREALRGLENIEFGEYRSGYTVDYRLAGICAGALEPFKEDVVLYGATAEVKDAACPTGGVLGNMKDRAVSAEKGIYFRDGFTYFFSPGEYAFAVEGEGYVLPDGVLEELKNTPGAAGEYMSRVTGVSSAFETLYGALRDSGREFILISDGSGGSLGAAAVKGDMVSLRDARRRAGEERTFFGLKRIGVMGGTFDPVHNGHLMAAEAVRERLRLEKIIFMPTGLTPYKKRDVTAGRHRYTMLDMAAESNGYFTVSSMETAREGFSYTADTMEELKKLCDGDAEIYFITGADVLEDMAGWKNFGRLAGICSFAAVTRPGYEAGAAALRLRDMGVRLYTVEAPALDISSSMIREALASGRSVKYLMPEAVEKYIKLHGLYEGSGEERGWEAVLRKLI